MDKEKIFAQYLGQKFIVPRSIRPDVKSVLDAGNLNHYPLDDIKLVLKPLSKISDEDAIECINIFLGSPDNSYKDWNTQDQKNWLQLMKLELTENFGSTQLKIKPYFKHVFMVGEFLRSKGYDFPSVHLNQKTLEQSGLAIYESEIQQ